MKSSGGFDLFDTKFVKKIAYYIKIPLVKIINKSFFSGTVSDFTRIAKIISVFKSGDPNNHKNY